MIHSGADQRELERPEGPRKWVSLSIRMLIMMRGRRRSSAEDEVGQAQLYLVRKNHMFYTIIQVRGEGGGVQQGRNEDRYWSTMLMGLAMICVPSSVCLCFKQQPEGGSTG